MILTQKIALGTSSFIGKLCEVGVVIPILKVRELEPRKFNELLMFSKLPKWKPQGIRLSPRLSTFLLSQIKICSSCKPQEAEKGVHPGEPVRERCAHFPPRAPREL